MAVEVWKNEDKEKRQVVVIGTDVVMYTLTSVILTMNKTRL